MSKQISKVGIVGSGTMGSGIAQLVAASGYQVVLIDLNDELLKKAVSRIEKNLLRLIEKDRITKKIKQQIVSRIKTSTKLDELGDCDHVIEAVSENINIKKQLY